MATLGLTYSELYSRVSDFLGTGSTPTGDALTKAKAIVSRGYRNFLYPIDPRTDEAYEWSFLKPLYTLPIQSGKWKYALPDNFSNLVTDPAYDDSSGHASLRKVSPEQILDLRSAGTASNPPAFYALVTSPYDMTIGSKYELWIHDAPDAAYNLKFFYKIDPLEPSATSDELVGGIRAIEAILESCLAVAETQEEDQIGIHYKIAKGLVKDLIRIDSKVDNGGIIGNLLSGSFDNVVERGANARFSLDNLYYGEGNTFSE